MRSGIGGCENSTGTNQINSWWLAITPMYASSDERLDEAIDAAIAKGESRG